MQGSLARTLALLESRQELLKEPDRGFTGKSCVLLTSLDPDTSSWKMSPQLRPKDLTKWSKTWPKWGMTAGGYAYAHPMWERRITGTGGFYWQTPVADDSVNRTAGKFNSRGEAKLSAQVKMWPTPAARDYKGQNSVTTMTRKLKEGRRAQQGQLPNAVAMIGDIGQLNPTWVEWLMGFPIGFTASKDWVTPKSRSKLQSPTDCSVTLPEWLR
jgi:hypothetical protein